MGGMSGDGNPFGDFEAVEAAVDFVEYVADDQQERSAGGFAIVDGDEDFFVFGIGFDAGEVVGFAAFGIFQDYATAPVGLVVDFFVGEDDEAGDDAFGQDAVVVLKL